MKNMNYKSNINILASQIRSKSFFIVLLVFSFVFFSCSNFLQPEKDDITISQDGRTYITIEEPVFERSIAYSRTIVPGSVDYSYSNLKNLVFTGQKYDEDENLGTEVTLASAETYSDISGKKIPLDPGTWNLKLEANLSGAPMVGIVENQTITLGTTSSIKFILNTKEEFNYGGYIITVKFDNTGNKVSKVEAKLFKEDKTTQIGETSTITEFTGTGNTKSIKLQRNLTDETERLEAGSYYMTFSFIKDYENDRSDVLNTFGLYLYIDKGHWTTWESSSYYINEIYNINYEYYIDGTQVTDDTTIASLIVGKTFANAYSSKSDEMILPVLSKSGYIFDGWYISTSETPEFVAENKVEKIKKGTSGNLTLCANFITSTISPTLYVSSAGNPEDEDGTESKPFTTLNAALSKIEENDDTGMEYTIIVDGEISSAESTSIEITKATSLTITGKTGNSSDSLNAILKGVPLIINTSVPVTMKNIKITKGSPYGIQVTSGKLTLDENSLISENITGVYISGGELNMVDGEISGNEANYGAGVYISYDDINKTLGKFTMSGGIISGNKANYGCGGGVLVDGTFNISEPEELEQFTGGDGSGNVLFTMTGGTISGNEENSTETDEYDVAVGGGGVCVGGKYANFIMSNSAIIKNNTAPNYGAGVSVWKGAKFIMNGGTIGGSTTSDGNIVGTEAEISSYGGGVYLGGNVDDDDSTFIMNNGTISNNESLGLGADPQNNDKRNDCGGAGVCTFKGSFSMVNGTISSNTSNRHGGGIYIGGKATFDMQGGSISGNSCTDNGKGVFQTSVTRSGVTYIGKFKIKGNSVVSSNNDVYLCDKLIITGALNAENKVATITPTVYSTSTTVLSIDEGTGSVSLTDIGAPEKFLITPQVVEGVTTNWEIDSEGNLKEGSSTNGGNGGGNGTPTPDNTNMVMMNGTRSYLLSGDYETSTLGDYYNIINNMYVGKQEITQAEFEKYMIYYGTAVGKGLITGIEATSTDKDYKPADSDNKFTTPAYYVSYPDALVYCNLRSKAEGFTPVYSMEISEGTFSSDPNDWIGVVEVGKMTDTEDENKTKFYTYTTYDNDSDWHPKEDYGRFMSDLKATGYRLPTLTEWKYIATQNVVLGLSDCTKNVSEWTTFYNYYGDSNYANYSQSINTKDELTPNYNYAYSHDSDIENIGFRVVRYVSDAPGYEYEDFELPSGLLWATCNVGADNPYDYGDYFAWGEVNPRYGPEEWNYNDNYNWTKYFDGSNGSNFTKYKASGTTELQSDNDTASKNMGESWTMPTKTQLQELIDNTFITAIDDYKDTGVSGVIVYKPKNDSDKGKNDIYSGDSGYVENPEGTYNPATDTHIFFPANGYRNGETEATTGYDVCIWTRTLNTTEESEAYFWAPAHKDQWDTIDDEPRYYGMGVRGVKQP